MSLYFIFNLVGIIAGGITAKLVNMPKPSGKLQIEILLAGAIGLILGAKLPVWILYGFSLNTILTGKSVMGGLLGVFIAINLYKILTHQKEKAFGGRFAIPFAVALGFGKIGCYFNGCCGGDFFIPIQLIESASQFIVAIGLYIFYKKTGRTDLLFPYYLLSYLIIRFIAEFIRHREIFAFGLTLYQIAAIVFLPVVISIIYKRRNIEC